MWKTKWKKCPYASVSCFPKWSSIHSFIHTQCISLSPSFFCSGFIPPLLMDTPHVWLIKNQLKTPRRQVSRATPAEGRIEALPALSASLKHSLSLSLSSSRLLHSQAPPSCLLEVGNMIYEKRGRNLYIFFLVHPLIYLLDFSSCLWWRGGWD